jgi:hypothetical protein
MKREFGLRLQQPNAIETSRKLCLVGRMRISAYYPNIQLIDSLRRCSIPFLRQSTLDAGRGLRG